MKSVPLCKLHRVWILARWCWLPQVSLLQTNGTQAMTLSNLYVNVYHFPLCYLIVCFSVGIYRQNTTSTISGVFILYLAIWGS
jgi:hypothetical protein